MAAGYLLPSPEFAKSGGVSILAPHEVAPWGGSMPSLGSYGARTNTQPVDELQEARGGSDQPMFGMADWYNRIHVNPGAVDAGFVITDRSESLSVWNAYLVPKTLASLSALGFDGISLTQPSTPPLVYEPLREHFYSLNIDSIGPADINASLTFLFSGANAPVVRVTGSRILLFPFAPNWKNPLMESLEWRTDVQRAYDGTEMRRSLRVTPRRSIEYDFTVRDDNVRLFEALTWVWQGRMFAVPMWMNRSNLTADVSVGATSISLPTTDLGFAADGIVVIFRSASDYEIVVADSVGPSSIALRYPLSRAWQEGDRVYPVLVGKMPVSMQTVRHTDRLITGKAEFMSSGHINDPFIPATAASVVYDGKEVVTTRPNWKSGIENTFSHEFVTLDGGTGAILWQQTETSGRISRPYSWLLKNRSEIAAFRAFVGRLSGQWKSCWIPSWHDDMTVVDLTVAGGSTLTIGGTLFPDYVGVDTARDRIAVVMNNGTTYYRKIGGVTVVGPNTALQLDTPFPEDVGPLTVRRVYLLLHCRMAGDKVTIPWQTDSVADPQVVFTTVPL